MKLIKSKTENRIVVSKKEWESIGIGQGWMKEAQVNTNDNVAVLVQSGTAGQSIEAFKVNPYNANPITAEEIMEAQKQLGILPPQTSSFKVRNLRAAETVEEFNKLANKDIESK